MKRRMQGSVHLLSIAYDLASETRGYKVTALGSAKVVIDIDVEKKKKKRKRKKK